MATLVLGSIVTYKNDYYVALGYDGHLVTIIAPHKGQRKLNVKRSNVTVVDVDPLVLVTHDCGAVPLGQDPLSGNEYLVSLGKVPAVISRTTNRVMNWPPTHGVRKAIIRKAEEIRNRAIGKQLSELAGTITQLEREGFKPFK